MLVAIKLYICYGNASLHCVIIVKLYINFMRSNPAIVKCLYMNLENATDFIGVGLKKGIYQIT